MSESEESTRSPWSRSAKIVVLVLAAALIVALSTVALSWRHDDSTSASYGADDAAALADAGAQAEKAARAAVTRMTTYDYRTVDADFSWVDDAGTERFQKYFASSRADAKPLIRRLQVIATGTVVDSAPRVDDVDHVHVLLFVDQKIRVADEQDTKVDQPRVTMEMVRQDDVWLVDAVRVNDLLTNK